MTTSFQLSGACGLWFNIVLSKQGDGRFRRAQRQFNSGAYGSVAREEMLGSAGRPTAGATTRVAKCPPEIRAIGSSNSALIRAFASWRQACLKP